jgi:predicted GTPase
LPRIKETIKNYAQTARENGWISDDDCSATIQRVDNDTITIGVIGQMKAGKSTFLNALLFEKEVLPAASTPMTASLTNIRYGEKSAIEAEFYTSDEWEELKLLSAKQEDTPQVKAARELVEKSAALGSGINQLLGTTKKAEFSELLEFVGSEGKYTAVTKAANITYPLEILKGVEIVDTPGFNDPVISREERTVQFLARADVVILLLYSGRAFDETDREIIFNKVRNVGVGKIIIAVNKYDVDLGKGELESDIQNYIREQILKALRERQEPVLNKLLGGINPVLISAYMALLAKKPLADIMANADEKYHYERLCNEVFEIKTQAEMYEKSRLAMLKDEINNLLKKEKLDILVNKSLNEISAKIDAKRTELDKDINRLSGEHKTLSLNPQELEEKQHNYERAKRKIERVIGKMEADLQEFINEKKKKTIHSLEQKKNTALANIERCIDSSKKADDAKNQYERVMRDLEVDFQYEYEEFCRIIKTELRIIATEAIAGIEELIERFFSGDGEKTIDYINSCRKELSSFDNLTMDSMFSFSDAKKNNAGLIVGGILSAVGLGAIGIAGFFIFKNLGWSLHGKPKMLENVKNSFMPVTETIQNSFSSVYKIADEFVLFFRNNFERDLIDTALQQVKAAEADYASREQRKEEIQQKLKAAEEEKQIFENQFKEANKITKWLLD